MLIPPRPPTLTEVAQGRANKMVLVHFSALGCWWTEPSAQDIPFSRARSLSNVGWQTVDLAFLPFVTGDDHMSFSRKIKYVYKY